MNGATTFLQVLFAPGDLIEIRPIETWEESGKKRSAVDHHGVDGIFVGLRDGNGDLHHFPNRLDTALAIARERAEALGTNLLFGVCPRAGKVEDFGKAWQVRTVRCLWSDLDNVDPPAALEKCTAAGLPEPSVVVNSGHGTHVYWLLSEPFLIDDAGDPQPVLKEWIDGEQGRWPVEYILDPKTGERLSLDAPQNVPPLSPKVQRLSDILAGIAAKIGGDHTHDLSRLMRLPATWNRKNLRNGAEPVPCELVSCEADQRYPIETFERFAEGSPPRLRRTQVGQIPLPSKQRMTKPRTERLDSLLAACAAAPIGERSEADFAVCAYAVELGRPRDDVWQQVQTIGKFVERGEEYFDRTWQAALLQVQQRRFVEAREKHHAKVEASRAVDSESELPTIEVNVDEWRVID